MAGLFSISYMGCRPEPIDEVHHFSRWSWNHQPEFGGFNPHFRLPRSEHLWCPAGFWLIYVDSNCLTGSKTVVSLNPMIALW